MCFYLIWDLACFSFLLFFGFDIVILNKILYIYLVIRIMQLVVRWNIISASRVELVY